MCLSSCRPQYKGSSYDLKLVHRVLGSNSEVLGPLSELGVRRVECEVDDSGSVTGGSRDGSGKGVCVG